MITQLDTPRLTVESINVAHAALLADFFLRNDAHLAPWDPPRPAGIGSASFWEAECERAVIEAIEGRVARWVFFMRGNKAQVIGRINYTQIARGPFQSCILGYAVDEAFERRGLMQEALAATIAHVFDVMQLHRIQASYIPANVRSGRLLQRLGFRREGVAPKYLFIDGEWRDHVITALLNRKFDDSVFQTLER
jgi:[ribosomal protein S5]-alanine N-acetyltransferase